MESTESKSTARPPYILCPDLVAPKLSFVKVTIGVYNTHDAKPGAYQAIAG
jgi:hypothetical protein